ncbi:DUF1493 family protein [Massilia sp. W12]|uniref:DUF1493 family protein n=1 Tax=Massilia sp. W12 TaxID=3126507 RepID=UPI0030CF7E85
MENHKLTEGMRQFLTHCGLRECKIASCQMHTRPYHDLGIYGDEALDLLDVLSKQYQVDLSDFEFAKYFPEEFPGGAFAKRIFLYYLPFGRWFVYRKVTWQPIILAQIDAAISAKKWRGT